MASLNLQTEIDAQITAGGFGGIVDLPPGQIPISNTINIQQVRGLVIRGKGAIATDLSWVGPRDLPMFRFMACDAGRSARRSTLVGSLRVRLFVKPLAPPREAKR